MIAFVRVASVNPDKTAAAMGFAKDIAAYIKAGYGADLEVLSPIAGKPCDRRVG